jgi:hypothetical protein
MEKKFYFLISLFLLLGLSSFAQFQEVAKLTEYSGLFSDNDGDRFGSSIAADGDHIVVGSTGHSGLGGAYVFYNNSGTYDTLAILRPSGENSSMYEYGNSVSISGDVIIIGGQGMSDYEVLVFVKPLTGWEDMTETASLSSSNPTVSDAFGSSLSISGDVIVVGDHQSGYVNIYEKPSEGWEDMTETAVLLPSDPVSGQVFGVAVSIDESTIVVGAESSEVAGVATGAAYVYEKPGTNWISMTETAKLTASDGLVGDEFGNAVAIDNTTIVVGAKSVDGGKGAAYVFDKPVEAWSNSTQTAKLTSTDLTAISLGFDVGIKDNTIAVGSDAQQAFVYEMPSAGWIDMTETGILTASEGESDKFANGLAIANDLIIVADAGYDKTVNANEGAAFLYEKPSIGWITTTESALLFSPQYLDLFYNEYGNSVAVDGNIAVVGTEDGGVAEILAFNGTTWEVLGYLKPDLEAAGYGRNVAISGDVIVVNCYDPFDVLSVYVYVKPSDGWTSMTETAKLTASDGASGDYFGSALAISGNTIVIGASGDDDNAHFSSGSAYVYEMPTAGWSDITQTAKLTASDGAANDNFGSSVSISNDVIVVGAYHDDDKGSAYVYEMPTAGWSDMSQTAKLTASDGATDDYFGWSVGISERYIFVGTYGDDDNGSMSGAVYFFEKTGSDWIDAVETQKITPDDGLATDFFGTSVSVDGDYVVIGANRDDDNGSSSGSAYIFDNSTGSWVQNAKIGASDGSLGDKFGSSVDIANNYIIVGAPEVDYFGFSNAGSAYLFQAPLTWTGATSTDWNTATNWDFNKEPLFYDDVFIDAGAQPTITNEANCFDIEMWPTAQMYMESSALDNSSSLIFGGEFIGSEIIQYRRYLQSNRWQMMSSPLSGQTINRFLTFATNSIVSSSGVYQMKDYDESSDSWTANYTSSTPGNLELAKGYVVERISDGKVYFEGQPNNASVNLSLTRNGMGWNLIGNPFTSSIAITDDALDADSYLLNTANLSVLDLSYQAIYVWVEDVTDRDNINNYKVINNGATGTLVQDYLQVAQGFFVKTKSGGGSFEITPEMQSHQTTIPFKKVENASWTNIILSAETADAKISTKVAYSEDMTRGLDPSYDAGFLNSDVSFAMYSKLIDDNGVDFMVQCLPSSYEDLIVPIGLDAEAGSTITFKAEVSNLPEDYVAVLEDRENETFTAFETEQSIYTLTLDNASAGTGRFYLHTSFKSALGANDLDQAKFSVFAQSSSNLLLINGNVEENTTAKVYDIRGKLVKTFDLQLGTQNRLVFNEQSGVYIIQIQNSKGIVSEKVNWVK